MDEDGSQIGVIPTREALARAIERGRDLVEIVPTSKPPVCRIMDYGKFKYDREKKERQARKHRTATRVKEIKFHANVGEHDYQTKIRHAHEFMQHGHRVKFSLFFRGRENVHRELGFQLMTRVAADCQDIGVIEQPARLMGRSLIMLMHTRPGMVKTSQREEEPEPEETEQDAAGDQPAPPPG